LSGHFEDHYSSLADAYARHRPRYPDALYAWLASLLPRRDLAWDAGTGSGQVAVALADYVERVVATDASAGQLQRAVRHERVEYRNERSEQVTLQPRSVDLVTAGAAVHWFDLDGFYREVRRVGAPDGVVALFSYGPRDFAAAAGPLVSHFHDEILGPFWPERIQYVHDRYATLPFPFDELEPPPLAMTVLWTFHDLLAFLETWSAAQRYFDRHGTRASEAIASALAEAWGDPSHRREIRWPIFVRAGRL
jgi:SAM-dependent methyltransferase